MTTPKPWTEAHKREALRWVYELAAELVGSERPDGPKARDRGDGLGWHASAALRSEAHFRHGLAGWSHLPPARIDREVRRVRVLAEGRLVRETGYRYEIRQGAYWLGSRAHRADAAAASKEAPGSHVVKVTIRRYSRRPR